MKLSYLKLLILLIALLGLTVTTATQAQDEKPTDQPVYYITAATDGIHQVYQHLLDGKSEARQITHAKENVLNFGVAYDGLSIAYISEGQLWLQSIHTEQAEALAPITAEQFISEPIYSQDGQSIAYTNDGVWLLDLETRETRQILENVALEEGATNAREFRIYQPKAFVLGDDGKAAKLIVDVGLWEWDTDGLYDLASGELQEFAPHEHLHTSLLVLSDGRVLLYGNNGVSGEFGLHLADNSDDINTYTRVLNFSEVTDGTLWTTEAIEIAPGIVRIYGPTVGIELEGQNSLYFDYDVNADTASEVQFVRTSEDQAQNVIGGPLSPDASIAAIYTDATSDNMGTPAGEIKLIDLATGEVIAADFPESSSAFHWQP
jgi:hypothetical protein